jgi:ketosteroid isomerase-like protein
MGGALESTTRRFLDSLDRKDGEAVIKAGAQDIQTVDEISRRWLRGIDELSAYIRQMMTMVDDVHTTISDVRENVLGDTGLLTCWMDQDYTLEGKPVHVSAPTTIVYRRESGGWKMLLFHSVPLPPEETSPN